MNTHIFGSMKLVNKLTGGVLAGSLTLSPTSCNIDTSSNLSNLKFRRLMTGDDDDDVLFVRFHAKVS